MKLNLNRRGLSYATFRSWKTLSKGLKRIPEGIVFDFNQGGGFLRIVFDSPLDSEIKKIKQGKKKLGLLEKDGITFFFLN